MNLTSAHRLIKRNKLYQSVWELKFSLKNSPQFFLFSCAFQFDPELEGHRFVSQRLLSFTLVKQSRFILLIYLFYLYFNTSLNSQNTFEAIFFSAVVPQSHLPNRPFFSVRSVFLDCIFSLSKGEDYLLN